MVLNDDIVEGDETFIISMDVPALFGPQIIAGSITVATATITDTSSKLCIVTTVHRNLYFFSNFVGIMVLFSKNKFTGTEVLEFVLVYLELVGGTYTYPFNVTVIPYEQSPVSAKGMYIRS